MQRAIGWIGLLMIMSGCAFLQKPDQPSGPISADPLEVDTVTTPSSDDASQPKTAVFQIVPGESTVRFELEEDLRSALTGWALGARITVVGTTDQVSGEFALDFDDLGAAQFGEIRINARTLETNEFLRNRAIENQILLTDTYEYITFQPTRVEGLPDRASTSESVTFSIIGDLSIRDVTRSETFSVTAKLLSPTQIQGSASTVIERETYGLTIPNVANVTFVEEEVELYIDFVAQQQDPN